MYQALEQLEMTFSQECSMMRYKMAVVIEMDMNCVNKTV